MNGDGPSIVVDTADPTPPYEQIRRQIMALISAGALMPSDRLPPVRHLANDLGLASGTVARSYRELEAEGWLQTRRGGGTRVADTPPAPASIDNSALASLTSEYVQRARFIGADDETILASVQAAM
jgi:DNA-binding transcriptional regulator YhcF (GntR family)